MKNLEINTFLNKYLKFESRKSAVNIYNIFIILATIFFGQC